MAKGDTTLSQDLDADVELQAHLAALEAETASDSGPPQAYSFQRVREDLDHVRDEIENIRSRLSVVKQQAVVVAKSNLEWADASAHDQLGSYPWAKLAGAMAATAFGVRVLRHLPVNAIATVAISLIVARLEAKSRR
ncbi:hypothetical protein AM571_PC00902 (plasmid) [Rhizobium etli 8C-3]|uniref:ElaB/YqjD/DUF883 family membrane-anchored ribosome-binding protein n=2 Tax=Rhizobium TaxID=379 RepID=A0A4R3QQS4_9HYPH|nr:MULTISPECIES: hypothetical protein [Rhizobium]APO78639.1 hypothetical protein AM571_PC00902 [Rhizobium etli 8C-3]TCU24568.1 hypothetical protein EV130_106160 [Rhizobium azibense]TCU39316.1 hypothetical protein EV129_103162 [Rhizobium azibense]